MWEGRRGVALGLGALAPRLQVGAVPAVMRFFVEWGLADRRDDVRAEMLAAAMAIVELHGKVSAASPPSVAPGLARLCISCSDTVFYHQKVNLFVAH